MNELPVADDYPFTHHKENILYSRQRGCLRIMIICIAYKLVLYLHFAYPVPRSITCYAFLVRHDRTQRGQFCCGAPQWMHRSGPSCISFIRCKDKRLVVYKCKHNYEIRCHKKKNLYLN